MSGKGRQKGATSHGSDQHGSKAHKSFVDGLHSRPTESAESEKIAQQGSPYGENESDGHHRLREGRQQHDEAEKNSEAKQE
jgi:hypothetical protein